MIVKALREGKHHALLLQVCLKENAKAARPGPWPAAARPADLELQLAVPTTVYHCFQAFHNLRWTGTPDRQIGAAHWQEWLQADTQRDAVQGLGPAPATRALDASAPGRALAPHTVPLANVPFDPAPEGAIRKSVPLPPAREATEPRNAPYVRTSSTHAGRCWNTQRKTRRRPPTSSRGGHADPCGTPRTPSPPPPPKAAGHAAAPEEEEDASGAARGAVGAAHQGSIPPRLAPLAPLWAPLGVGSPHRMAPAHPGDVAAPADPAAMPARDS